MDQELKAHIREARKIVFETIKQVRDDKIDIPRASAINKGARELANLGKLEAELSQWKKGAES